MVAFAATRTPSTYSAIPVEPCVATRWCQTPLLSALGLTTVVTVPGLAPKRTWPSRPTRNFFTGLIDETAIYPAALSAASVTRHFTANRTALVPTPVAAPKPKISSQNVTTRTRKKRKATATFVLRLSAASKQTVTVAYATRNGTARAGRDYRAVSGTLTFRPGQVTRSVNISVVGRPKLRRVRTYQLRMGQARGATLRAYYVTGRIQR